MANIMTKRGSQDNVVTYEHICDTAADIAKIEKRYCTLGSVCIVIDGDSGGLEVYMADSAGEWSAVMTGGTSSSGASLEIHPCGNNEIDSETGLPDIDSPSNSIIYLVPSGAEEDNNLYNEYIYVDGEWEKFGGATVDLSTKADKDNTVITGSLSLGRTENSRIGENSVALGNNIVASGNAAHAEGVGIAYDGKIIDNITYNGSGAHGAYSHAEGTKTWAIGAGSHAEGNKTVASGENSHAEGEDTIANLINLHVGGQYNTFPLFWTAHQSHQQNSIRVYQGKLYKCKITHTSSSYFNSSYWTDISDTQPLFVIGNGTADNARKNAFVVYRNGAVAEGVDTTASEAQAHAEGGGTTASGVQSHAEGSGTIASGTSTHAEGSGARATASGAHAEGGGTLASGPQAHAEGGGTTASGDMAHAEGNGSRATAMSSHAEGGGTIASGGSSHAEGGGVTASGDCSHAEGGGTTASGSCSHAEGDGTIAQLEAEHVSGKFNTKYNEWAASTAYAVNDLTVYNGTLYKCKTAHESGSSFVNTYWTDMSGSQPIFIIGNGTADNARHDAFVLNTNSSVVMGPYPADPTEFPVWTSNTTYEVGKIVSYNNSLYRCKKNHTSENSFSSNYWSSINPAITAAVLIGAGYDNSNKRIGLNINWAGGISEGQYTLASAPNTHTEGYSTYTQGGGGQHAEGYQTSATGSYGQHAEGYGTAAAGGYGQHAEGYFTSADGGSGQHAEGSHTYAGGGEATHAEGKHTIASGGGAQHAEGIYTSAYGALGEHAEGVGAYATGGGGAHAEGYGFGSTYDESTNTFTLTGPEASGQGAHAEGYGDSNGHPIASATGSHAEGYATTASGIYSHAEGNNTIANLDSEHVGGRFNAYTANWIVNHAYTIDDLVVYNGKLYKCTTAHTSGNSFDSTKWNDITSTSPIFVIGNGTADNNRSNALVLDRNGNEHLKGDIYVGCNADSTGGTKLEPLPAVTSSDNNKVLEVVNGEWTVGSEKANIDYEWTVKTWKGFTNFDGYNIWTDGTYIYYSNTSAHYVFDKSTFTWSTKTWTGLTNFYGSNIWTDGIDIYHSNGSSQQVLNKSTSTWSTKTWTGLSNFYGTHVWTDGTNIYYSNGSTQYVLDKSTSVWSHKTWTGLTSFDGNNIWTNGADIYYSSSSNQYVLDKSTSTWSTKTWTGLTSFDGKFVWTAGINIYYSNGTTQYVLDKSTSTWSTKIWNGLTNFSGTNIWTDGTDIYFCNLYSTHYVLCKLSNLSDYVLIASKGSANGVASLDASGKMPGDQFIRSSQRFISKTWTGLTYFNGGSIWTDGTDIYFSATFAQYVLNKSTSTWSTKTWNELTAFDGSYIWADGINYYYSYHSDQYVLDKSTSTWSTKEWTGLTNFDGKYVWTDGTDIYYSDDSDQYVLDKSTSTWSTKIWTGLTSFMGDCIWTDGTDIYYSNGSNHYVLDKSTSIWSIKEWTGLTSFNGKYVWTNGADIYYSNYSDQYVLDKSTSTWSTKTWTEVTSFIGSNIWTDGTNIYYSGGTSQYKYVSASTLAAIDTNGDLVDSGKSLSDFIPANPPTTDGTYTLQCVVTNGVPTYSWIPMTNFVTLDT